MEQAMDFCTVLRRSLHVHVNFSASDYLVSDNNWKPWEKLQWKISLLPSHSYQPKMLDLDLALPLLSRETAAMWKDNIFAEPTEEQDGGVFTTRVHLLNRGKNYSIKQGDDLLFTVTFCHFSAMAFVVWGIT